MKLAYVVTAIAAATLLSATVAEAQTTLYACYVKNTGTVYRIKTDNAPTKCSNNHVEFSWNMEGQVGPQGPQGPEGPQGPAGPSAWPGVVVRTIELTVPAGEMRDFGAFCLSNQVLLSGGHSLSGVVTDFLLFASVPIQVQNGDLSMWGWKVRIKNTSATQPFNVTAWAYCRAAID